MAEQGKADMEEQIKNLEEEKRQLEQQVCVRVCMYLCACVYVVDFKNHLTVGLGKEGSCVTSCHWREVLPENILKLDTQPWHRMDGLRVSLAWLQRLHGVPAWLRGGGL